MKNKYKRPLAVGLSTVFLMTQVLFSPASVQLAFAQPTSSAAPASQSDFWKTRATRLPRVSSSLANLTTHKSNLALVPKKKISSSSPASTLLQDALSFIRVGEIHRGRADQPHVFLFQDVHMNTEAQMNIGKALSTIKASQFVVGVEAAAGAFDFDRYRQFPDKEALRQVSNHLLNEDLIAAVSWMGLTMEQPPLVVGIDDPTLYQNNVLAFQQAAPHRSRFQSMIQNKQQDLNEQAETELNPTLLSLYHSISAYNKGKLNIADFAQSLNSFITLSSYPELHRFVKAVEMEKTLNPEKAQQERDLLIERLSSHDQKAMESLVVLSLSLQAKERDTTSFYSELHQLIQEAGVDLTAYPHFDSYLSYIKQADAINQKQLFIDAKAMEQAAIHTLAPSKKERDIFAEAKELHLTDKLVRFELTPSEWEEYKKSNIDIKDLSSFEDFYRNAELRNDKMAANLLNITKAKSSQVAALVVGGFHTEGLTEIFRHKGVSYSVLSPLITRIDGSGSKYLNTFIRERAPLVKLFEGKKLTVALANRIMGPVRPIIKTGLPVALSHFVLLLAGQAGFRDKTISNEERAAIVEASGGLVSSVRLLKKLIHVKVGNQTIEVSQDPSNPNLGMGLGYIILKPAGLFGISAIALILSGLAVAPALGMSGVVVVMSMVSGIPDNSSSEPAGPSANIYDWSPEKLWENFLTGGKQFIDQTFSGEKEITDVIHHKLYQYLLTHSAEAIARDLVENLPSSVSYEDAKWLLLNPYFHQSEHRLPKIRKIMELLPLNHRTQIEYLSSKLSFSSSGKYKPRKIAYLSGEIKGFWHSGGIGMVADAYPKTVWGMGHDIVQFMPYYEGVGMDERINVAGLERKFTGIHFSVPMGENPRDAVQVSVDIVERPDGPPVYLLRSDKYSSESSMGHPIDEKGVRDTSQPVIPYYSSHDDFTDGEAFALERFVFFSKASLFAMQKIEESDAKLKNRPQQPYDTLHYNDWHSSLSASWMSFLKTTTVDEFVEQRERYPHMKTLDVETFLTLQGYLKNTAVVGTIHNAAYQGLFGDASLFNNFDRVSNYSEDLFRKLGLPTDRYFTDGANVENLRYHGQLNFLNAVGVSRVVTVGENHDQELIIPESEGGYGYIPGLLNYMHDQGNFSAIQNGGIGYDQSPDKLEGITNYTKKTVHEIKPKNKLALLRKVGLLGETEDLPEDAIVLGVVGRMVEDKGWELIAQAFRQLSSRENVYLVALGTGEEKIQTTFRKLQEEFPENVSATIAFNKNFGNLIRAGSDAFLAPSVFEPSGLVQFESMVLGTLPIATPVVKSVQNGITGFVMQNVDSVLLHRTKARNEGAQEIDPQGRINATGAVVSELTSLIELAIKTYRTDRTKWNQMMENAMDYDPFWDTATEKYLDVYDEAAEKQKDSASRIGYEFRSNTTLSLEGLYFLSAFVYKWFTGRPLDRAVYARKGAPWTETPVIAFFFTISYFLLPSILGITADAPSFLSLVTASGLGLFLIWHYIEEGIISAFNMIRGVNRDRGPPIFKSIFGRLAGVTILGAVFLLGSTLFTFPQSAGVLPIFSTFLITHLFTTTPVHSLVNKALVTLGLQPLSIAYPINQSDDNIVYKTKPTLNFASGYWPGLAGKFQRDILQGKPVSPKSQAEDLILKSVMKRLVQTGQLRFIGKDGNLDPNMDKIVLVIARRIYQGMDSQIFYNTPIVEEVRKIYGNKAIVKFIDFPIDRINSDFAGMVEASELAMEYPDIYEYYEKGYPIGLMTDGGFKTRLRLGAIATWMGHVPLPTGPFITEQTRNLLSLWGQLPHLGRDTESVRGSDNINNDHENKVGSVPLKDLDTNPGTKGWSILLYGEPFHILDDQHMKLLEAKLTDDEKSGKYSLTPIRAKAILGDQYDIVAGRINEIARLGAISRDPETGQMIRFIEKFPTMGLNVNDMVMEAYKSGGTLLKNMYQWTKSHQAVKQRNNMANFQIRWNGQTKRIRDLYKPRYFQAWGGMFTSATAEDFIAHLPNDLKTTNAEDLKGLKAGNTEGTPVRHLYLMWHLAQALHYGGEVDFQEDDEGNYIITRYSHDKKTIYETRNRKGPEYHRSRIYQYDRSIRQGGTVVSVHESLAKMETASSNLEIKYSNELDNSSEALPNLDASVGYRYKSYESFDPNPIYVVSIGEDARWSDAGNYPELISLYKWLFFDKEGRDYAGLPGPDVKVIDSYIDPNMVKENRIHFPDGDRPYAIFNSSIRGEGKVVIEANAALAWVDIYVPEGEILIIGQDYIWMSGSTQRGGRLVSGPQENEKGGLLLEYHHPDDQSLVSNGGEVLKTLHAKKGPTHKKVVLRDNLKIVDRTTTDSGVSRLKFLDNTGAFKDDETIGDDQINGTFDEWRILIDALMTMEENKKVRKNILRRNKKVVNEVDLEAAVIKIGEGEDEGAVLVKPMVKQDGVHWYIREVERDTLGFRQTKVILPDEEWRVVPSRRGLSQTATHIAPGETESLQIGTHFLDFHATVGEMGALKGKNILNIIEEDGKFNFAVSEEHPTLPNRTIIGNDGKDIAIDDDANWQSIPVRGVKVEVKSRFVRGANAITHPESPHISSIERYHFVKSGRAYAKPEDVKAILEERDAILIDAQNSEIMGISEKSNLLRTLSALYETLEQRKDIPVVILWPTTIQEATKGLTLAEQIAHIEKGLTFLLDREENPVNLGDINLHIIAPQWKTDDDEINDRLNIERNKFFQDQKSKKDRGQNPLRRFHVTIEETPGPDVKEVFRGDVNQLKAKGINLIFSTDLEYKKLADEDGEIVDGVINYNSESISKTLQNLGKAWKTVLGWGEDAQDAAMLVLDLEETMVNHHVGTSRQRGSLKDESSEQVRELFEKLNDTGLRYAISTTANEDRVMEALVEYPRPPTGKPVTWNTSSAHRITQINADATGTTSTVNPTFEENRFIDMKLIRGLEYKIRRLVRDTRTNDWKPLERHLRRAYRGRTKGSQAFNFNSPSDTTVERVKVGGKDFASRIFINHIPSEREFVRLDRNEDWPTYLASEGQYKPIPRLRENMVAKIQELLDTEYNPNISEGNIQLIAVPVGTNFIQIIQRPIEASYGKQAFLEFLTQSDEFNIPAENVLLVEDQIYPDHMHSVPGMAIAATNQNQETVPLDQALPVGPMQEGAAFVLKLLLEIIDEELKKDDPEPAVKVLIRRLKEMKEQNQLPGQVDSSEPKTRIERPTAPPPQSASPQMDPQDPRDTSTPHFPKVILKGHNDYDSLPLFPIAEDKLAPLHGDSGNILKLIANQPIPKDVFRILTNMALALGIKPTFYTLATWVYGLPNNWVGEMAERDVKQAIRGTLASPDRDTEENSLAAKFYFFVTNNIISKNEPFYSTAFSQFIENGSPSIRDQIIFLLTYDFDFFYEGKNYYSDHLMLIRNDRRNVEKFTNNDWRFAILVNRIVAYYNSNADDQQQISLFPVIINGQRYKVEPVTPAAESNPLWMMGTGAVGIGLAVLFFLLQAPLLIISATLFAGSYATVIGLATAIANNPITPVATSNATNAFGELNPAFLNLPLIISIGHRMEEFSHFLLEPFFHRAWRNEFLSHSVTLTQFVSVGALLHLLATWGGPVGIVGMVFIALSLLIVREYHFAEKLTKISAKNVRESEQKVMEDLSTRLAWGLLSARRRGIINDMQLAALNQFSPLKLPKATALELGKYKNLSRTLLAQGESEFLVPDGIGITDQTGRQWIAEAVGPVLGKILSRYYILLTQSTDPKEKMQIIGRLARILGFRAAIEDRQTTPFAILLAGLMEGSGFSINEDTVRDISFALDQARSKHAKHSTARQESMIKTKPTSTGYYSLNDLLRAEESLDQPDNQDTQHLFMGKLQELAEHLYISERQGIISKGNPEQKQPTWIVSERLSRPEVVIQVLELLKRNGIRRAGDRVVDRDLVNNGIEIHAVSKADPFLVSREIKEKGYAFEQLVSVGFYPEFWDFSNIEAYAELNPDWVSKIIVNIFNLTTGKTMQIQDSIIAAMETMRHA